MKRPRLIYGKQMCGCSVKWLEIKKGIKIGKGKDLLNNNMTDGGFNKNKSNYFCKLRKTGTLENIMSKL